MWTIFRLQHALPLLATGLINGVDKDVEMERISRIELYQCLYILGLTFLETISARKNIGKFFYWHIIKRVTCIDTLWLSPSSLSEPHAESPRLDYYPDLTYCLISICLIPWAWACGFARTSKFSWLNLGTIILASISAASAKAMRLRQSIQS